jgi:hypothetical protein
MTIAPVRLTSATWQSKRRMVNTSDLERAMRTLLYVVIALPLAILGLVSAVVALIALPRARRSAL